MELLDALQQTFDRAHDVIAGVRPDQYDDKTPCPEWTVRDLLEHQIGVVGNLGSAAAGQSPSPFTLAADPATQFETAATAAMTASARAGSARQGRGVRPRPDAGRVLARHQPARHRDPHVGLGNRDRPAGDVP